MPGKPFLFRAYAAYGRWLGHERLTALLALDAAWGLRLSPARAGILRGLERVLKTLGRAHAPEDLEAQLSLMARRFAAQQADLYRLDERLAEADAVRLDIAPRLAAARAAGRGAVLAVPHMGNLALGLPALAKAGFPMTALILNERPYRWIEPLCPGLRFAGLGSAAAACARALARNELVVLYADMDFFPDARALPFFGAPARPPHGPARLAAAFGAPVVVGACAWEDGAWRFAGSAPLAPELGQEALESAIAAELERQIARAPEQWYLFQDPWDLEGTGRANRLRLKALRWLR